MNKAEQILQQFATEGEEETMEGLSKTERRQRLREQYGIYSVSFLAKRFSVSRSTIHRDLQHLGTDAIDESTREFLILQNSVISDLIKTRMLDILENSNPACAIGAAKILLQLLQHAIKIKIDLGIIPLPTKRIEQTSTDAVTHEDFARIYAEMREEGK